MTEAIADIMAHEAGDGPSAPGVVTALVPVTGAVRAAGAGDHRRGVAAEAGRAIGRVAGVPVAWAASVAAGILAVASIAITAYPHGCGVPPVAISVWGSLGPLRQLAMPLAAFAASCAALASAWERSRHVAAGRLAAWCVLAVALAGLAWAAAGPVTLISSFDAMPAGDARATLAWASAVPGRTSSLAISSAARSLLGERAGGAATRLLGIACVAAAQAALIGTVHEASRGDVRVVARRRRGHHYRPFASGDAAPADPMAARAGAIASLAMVLLVPLQATRPATLVAVALASAATWASAWAWARDAAMDDATSLAAASLGMACASAADGSVAPWAITVMAAWACHSMRRGRPQAATPALLAALLCALAPALPVAAHVRAAGGDGGAVPGTLARVAAGISWSPATGLPGFPSLDGLSSLAGAGAAEVAAAAEGTSAVRGGLPRAACLKASAMWLDPTMQGMPLPASADGAASPGRAWLLAFAALDGAEALALLSVCAGLARMARAAARRRSSTALLAMPCALSAGALAMLAGAAWPGCGLALVAQCVPVAAMGVCELRGWAHDMLGGGR